MCTFKDCALKGNHQRTFDIVQHSIEQVGKLGRSAKDNQVVCSLYSVVLTVLSLR